MEPMTTTGDRLAVTPGGDRTIETAWTTIGRMAGMIAREATLARRPGAIRGKLELLAASAETLGAGLQSVASARFDAESRRRERQTEYGLSDREMEVLRCIARGCSNIEVGNELFISEDTVKTHARRLYKKLGARDRAHAVAIAWRLKILT